MTVARGMVGAALVSWIAVAVVVRDARLATFFGMIAPLMVAVTSWLIAERAWRRDPPSVTPILMTAFGAKMLFFGAYVAVMLKAVAVAAVPFIVSFAGYFIALHLIEALALRAMFAGTWGQWTVGRGD
jgi:hypothetical protein